MLDVTPWIGSRCLLVRFTGVGSNGQELLVSSSRLRCSLTIANRVYRQVPPDDPSLRVLPVVTLLIIPSVLNNFIRRHSGIRHFRRTNVGNIAELAAGRICTVDFAAYT